MVIEKAKRLVENGQRCRDPARFDHATRPRATTPSTPHSGKILSGGVEPALQKPKHFFGAARKIEPAARSHHRDGARRDRVAGWTR